MHSAIVAAPDRTVDETPRPGVAPPRVSVVVPCFNEELVLAETHRRLVAACATAAGDDWEIVYVNDGSRDRTWSILAELARSQPGVVAVDLSRNFGHQRAVSAGLGFARGERILMIDADLQDPPELLASMMQLMDDGADVVYGKRTGRRGETGFKRATASVFYRVLRGVSDVDIPLDTGDFRLISRRVLDELLRMPEQHRYLRGLVAWLGFRQVPIEYVRDARFAGETKYPFARMLRFAADAIAGFSSAPLRVSMMFAGFALLTSIGVGLYVLVSWLFFDTVRGWPSVLLAVSFFSAVQLFALGMLGEYVGRIYDEAKRRPLFVVRELVTSERVPATHEPPAATRTA